MANELDFLRTKVNHPTSRFDELKAFIECFRFPTSVGRLPITLLRKIVSQNIILRCRVLLSLQPIKQADAEALDKLIIRKVHDALGFPFLSNLQALLQLFQLLTMGQASHLLPE